MASEVILVKSGLYDELKCSVCSDLLKDPVTLECMHHFCASCFIQSYGNTGGCPHCNKPISSFAVKPNPLLQKIVDLIQDFTTPDYFGQVQKDLKDIIKRKEGHVQFLTQRKQEEQQKICSAEENGEKIRLRIAAEFRRLHAIMEKEEATLLFSVKQEETLAVSHLQDNVQKIETQIQALSSDLAFIKETLIKSGDCNSVENS